MDAVKATSTDHKDLIHDISYDYYGDRMATCSSDQTVKVNYICLFILLLATYLMRATVKVILIIHTYDIAYDGTYWHA